MKPFTFSGVLLVNILLSLFLGYKLDEWLNTTPIFIILGLIYSVVGSIYILLHKANKHE
ncbi:AtpZ/AtpI family protein [Faecalitalea cylindroides]|uniref:AtpZ/AtpI family protein n=1 Tax=Faecalitalea cylindroides TaxID=39483 RepID=UPI00242E8011|nr:AtpZ/AtpI family protein [Faecalitalea cylindroides]